jgi:predicted DNA-binding protein (MmcQ/YjbR family)
MASPKPRGDSGSKDPTLQAIRKVVLSLPDTVETPTWGKPHFRVGDKIFCGYGEELGRPSVGFKLEMEHAARLVATDPRFARAPYVGHKGWVSMDARGLDVGEVAPLILESYRLIASKRSLAKLEGGPAPAEPAKARPARASTAKSAKSAKGRAAKGSTRASAKRRST